MRLDIMLLLLGLAQGDAAADDPKKYGTTAREAIMALVRHRIEICGCALG